jgi:hypothetical protein
MSQSSVTCAWPKLGGNVIFSNERVNESPSFTQLFTSLQEPLAVVRDRRDHYVSMTGGAA